MDKDPTLFLPKQTWTRGICTREKRWSCRPEERGGCFSSFSFGFWSWTDGTSVTWSLGDAGKQPSAHCQLFNHDFSLVDRHSSDSRKQKLLWEIITCRNCHRKISVLKQITSLLHLCKFALVVIGIIERSHRNVVDTAVLREGCYCSIPRVTMGISNC